MKVIAIVMVEPFFLDVDKNLKRIVDDLRANDITPKFVYRTSDLKDVLAEMSENQPIVWYEHQNYMIHNLCFLKDWLVQNIDGNFPAIQDPENHILGFYPKGINWIRGKCIEVKNYFFHAKNILKTYVLPQVESPRIILFTREREHYFRLTLNALVYSFSNLPEIERPPITVVLNEPTESSQRIALDGIKKYGSKGDILAVSGNSKLSAVCIAQIWHRPESIVLFEDDFILPKCVKNIYPNWAKQFREKLHFYDVCCWGLSMDNYPFIKHPPAHYKSNVTAHEKYGHGELWRYNQTGFVTAQGLAVTSKRYIETCKKHGRIAIDHLLVEEAVLGICSPTMVGYHVGWNQELDGYGSTQDHNWQDFGYSGTYEVKNLITDEIRTICPIKDLF